MGEKFKSSEARISEQGESISMKLAQIYHLQGYLHAVPYLYIASNTQWKPLPILYCNHRQFNSDPLDPEAIDAYDG